jgi:hypothetical protein
VCLVEKVWSTAESGCEKTTVTLNASVEHSLSRTGIWDVPSCGERAVGQFPTPGLWGERDPKKVRFLEYGLSQMYLKRKGLNLYE